MKYVLLIVILSTLFFSCDSKKSESTLYLLKDNSTGIEFENTLVYTEQLNPYTYRNFYNGGGVALGDINNDGLLDIYFTGNLVNNKLYLNKGNFKFEDITSKAGVACDNVWSSGATFVDINNDGLLDIYVCKAGPPSDSPNRSNELFINNGDLTFTEQSKKYGLNITGLSVQAAFFDFDKDGDLDCYLLNNSIRSVGGYDLIKDQRDKATASGNKLFKNENGFFIDASKENNIYTSAIGFGLGITLSDFNQDNWTDIYISNDFFEKDYLYLNNNGLNFEESVEEKFNAIPMGSMGADAADLDNDLLPDMMVTEMLPQTLERQKSKATYESWDKYSLAVKNGYFYQFPRNALQRNLGASGFMEISRFSGVDATEWSWGTLLFDMNNDGLKDIFVSNGIYKDLLDRDYLNYMANEAQIRNMMSNDKNIITKLIDLMPSKAIPNAAYLNLGDFSFKEANEELGLNTPSFSNGSAYGDLDNDGDLDLVVNNVNMASFVYENTTDTTKNKFIKIRFKGKGNNTSAIGTKIIAYFDKGKNSMFENYPSKGFQSSVAPEILMGFGNISTVDSLVVIWPDQAIRVLKNLTVNKTITIEQQNSSTKKYSPPKKIAAFGIEKIAPFFSFKHEENNYIDFKREQLLDRMTNNEGPAMATADLNGDGFVDFYLGGAKNQKSQLFMSNKDGSYATIDKPFEFDKNAEDTDAIFFDSDLDGDLDLYVCSGGKAFSKYDSNLEDRLYINTNNTFIKSTSPLPFPKRISSASVEAFDYDLDGDLDLFVGERYNPQVYGEPSSGFLLKNEGNNKFSLDQQGTFESIGMITKVVSADLNNDNWPDLVIGGEWMPISIFINKNGQFINETNSFQLNKSVGIWSTLAINDIDDDGDFDIIAGNIGQNNFYKKGTTIFVYDFDNNGTTEQIICQKTNGKYYPIADRDELISQIPSLKKKLLYYKDYAIADMETMFTAETLKASVKLTLDTSASALFINHNNTFESLILPPEIQYSQNYAIQVYDITKDGVKDIFFGGNQDLIKPRFGKLDASKGWLLTGTKINGQYRFNEVSPLNISGQIRGFKIIQYNQRTILTTSINNDILNFYEIK